MYRILNEKIAFQSCRLNSIDVHHMMDDVVIIDIYKQRRTYLITSSMSLVEKKKRSLHDCRHACLEAVMCASMSHVRRYLVHVLDQFRRTDQAQLNNMTSALITAD